LSIGTDFFLNQFKNKIIYNFCENSWLKILDKKTYFCRLLFVVVVGSGIWDGKEKQDPECAIRDKHPLPDPQNSYFLLYLKYTTKTLVLWIRMRMDPH
jgi:hypothetical protein